MKAYSCVSSEEFLSEADATFPLFEKGNLGPSLKPLGLRAVQREGIERRRVGAHADETV
jgi:hypothetical protein